MSISRNCRQRNRGCAYLSSFSTFQVFSKLAGDPGRPAAALYGVPFRMKIKIARIITIP
jgi:hypothetical protein